MPRVPLVVPGREHAGRRVLRPGRVLEHEAVLLEQRVLLLPAEGGEGDTVYRIVEPSPPYLVFQRVRLASRTLSGSVFLRRVLRHSQGGTGLGRPIGQAASAWRRPPSRTTASPARSVGLLPRGFCRFSRNLVGIALKAEKRIVGKCKEWATIHPRGCFTLP